MSGEGDDVKPSKLCRICLSSSVKMYMSIFEKYRDIAINDYILLLTNVDIKKEDGLPDKICSSCFMEFETAVSFKRKCENSDLFLKTSKDKIIEACAKADVEDIIIVKKEDPYETQIKFEEVADDSAVDEYYGVEALDEVIVGDVTKALNPNVEYHEIEAFEETTVDNLQVYNVRKPKETNVECHDCGNIFQSKCKLRVHWRKVHMLAALVCGICKRQFKSYKAYNIHKKKLTKSCTMAASGVVQIEGEGKSRIFHCKMCNYKSSRSKDIYMHSLVHSGIKSFQCNICQNKYTQQSSLQCHMENAHKQYQKEITCHFCGKQVKGRSQIYRHMLTHTETKNPCPVCQKMFPKRHLKQHMLRHSGTKSYTCEMCASTFFTLAELCNHKRWVHNKKKDAFKCDLCSYTASRNERVKRHRKKHTDTNIPCTVCGMFFPTVQKLDNHQKHHFEEKTHECPYCDMKFHRRQSVGKHIRCKHKIALQMAKEQPTSLNCSVDEADNVNFKVKIIKNLKQEQA